MSLKAGYKGLKKIGSGLKMSSDGTLSATGGGQGTEVVANPAGTATADLVKLEVDDVIYGLPDMSDVYQTTDTTESTLADADYVPFLDSSAASGSGAPRKSTWSNIKAKLKSYFDTLYNNYELPTASDSTLGGVKVGSGLSITDGVLAATGGGGGTDVEANPSGSATAGLTKLKVDTDIYSIPQTTDCYQSTDIAETTLADADTVPFYDASAAANRNTTWSNIKSVLKTYFDTLYNKYVLPTASASTLGGIKVGTGLSIDGSGVLSASGGGGGGSYTRTVLYGSDTCTYPASTSSPITLSDSLANYDFIELNFGFNTGNVLVIATKLLDSNILQQLNNVSVGENSKLLICDIYPGGSQYIRVGKNDNTHLSLLFSSGVGIYNVVGYKFS